MPLLFFCIALTYKKMHNKAAFFMPLIAANAVISTVIVLQPHFNPLGLHQDFHTIASSGILGTIIAVFTIIWLLERCIAKKAYAKTLLGVVLISQFIFIPWFMFFISSTNRVTGIIVSSLLMIVSLWNNMGGLFFVVMGLVIYFTIENKKHLAGAYVSFCFIYFIVIQFEVFPRLIFRATRMFFNDALYFYFILMAIADNLLGVTPGLVSVPLAPLSLRFENYSWMMIFALLFMVTYKDCATHTKVTA